MNIQELDLPQTPMRGLRLELLTVDEVEALWHILDQGWDAPYREAEGIKRPLWKSVDRFVKREQARGVVFPHIPNRISEEAKHE
jgi:hypothetical protein